MAIQTQNAAASTGDCVPGLTCANRARWRFRFRLRTLLLLPLVIVTLLLLAFPKLLTGDYIEARIVSIDDYGTGISIEMDACISGGTRWGATNAMRGGGMGVSSDSKSHWTRLLPTWPKHTSITINLSFNRTKLLPDSDFITDVLRVQQGETYRATPNKPLDLVLARYIDGAEGRCWFEVSRGSRLGL